MSAEWIPVLCDEVKKKVAILIDLSEALCTNHDQCRAAGIDCLFCSGSSVRLPLADTPQRTYIESEIQRIRKHGGRIGLQTFLPEVGANKVDIDDEMRSVLSKAASELADRLRKAKL